MDNIFDFAKVLDGRQYRNEITKEEEQKAKELGFVIVFGASDDLMEFRGAIDDEVGCPDGGSAYITTDGLVVECEYNCKYYQQVVKKKAEEIRAIWCGENVDGFTWSYKVDFPHACFKIFDGDDKYCMGIVFDLVNINKLTKKDCEEAIKQSDGCCGYAIEDELVEQCKNCKENNMHPRNTCGREAEIEDAIKFLSENGYAVIEITESMQKRMDKCVEGDCEAEDCAGCCCSICILNDC